MKLCLWGPILPALSCFQQDHHHLHGVGCDPLAPQPLDPSLSSSFQWWFQWHFQPGSLSQTRCIYLLPHHFTLGAKMPLRGLWSCCSPHPGGSPTFHGCWAQTPGTIEQEPIGPSQDWPHPVSSAVAPLWSTEVMASGAHSWSCYTDAKTPTEWKKLTTWWAWTHSPLMSVSGGYGFDSKRNFAPPASCWGFSFALWHGASFFGGIQHSPVDGCSAASCSFGVLTGEDERMSYSTILFLFGLLFAKETCSIFPRQ